MNTRLIGLTRLRRAGAIGVAGGFTLVAAMTSLGLPAWMWLAGALLGAELSARWGSGIAGESPLHALWLVPFSGPLVALAAAATTSVVDHDLGAGLAFFGVFFALAWGLLVGAGSALYEPRNPV